MSETAQIVSNYLRTDRSMSGARKLYLKYGLQLELKSKLNRGEVQASRLLEIQKTLAAEVGISEADFKVIMAQKTSYWKQMPLPESEDPKLPDTKGELGQQTIVQGKIASIAPEPVKQAMNLRVSYPFLAERNGPAVLKSLVSSLIQAYDTFRFAHEDLFDAEGEKEQAAIAESVVENYLENRVIWEEFEHFKKTGKLLGKHPDVAKYIADSEVDEMDALKLSKEKINLEKSINMYQNLIKKSNDAGKIANWNGLIEQKKYRLNRVNTRLEALK